MVVYFLTLMPEANLMIESCQQTCVDKYASHGRGAQHSPRGVVSRVSLMQVYLRFVICRCACSLSTGLPIPRSLNSSSFANPADLPCCVRRTAVGFRKTRPRTNVLQLEACAHSVGNTGASHFRVLKRYAMSSTRFGCNYLSSLVPGGDVLS